MESANKALMMAFGMIVAILIIGSISFVFSKLRVMPEEDDLEELIEQSAAFNLEYEVYDKRIMYGVDVISVLNKAKSNNDKYVQGNFLSGQGYNTDYIIDIIVILKTDLKEEIEVTYLEETGDGIVERSYFNNGPLIMAKDKFKRPSETYSDLIYGVNDWDDFKLQSQTIPTKVEDGTYHLLSGAHGSIIPGEYTNAMIEGNSTLKSLLEQSAEMSQTVKNSGSNRLVVKNPPVIGDIDSANTGWNRATWYPAIYDLKTRKFKCLGEEIEYNRNTGRIMKMVFEEI